MRQYLRQYLTADWSLQSLDYAELSTRILSYMSSECPPFRPVHCGRWLAGPQGRGRPVQRDELCSEPFPPVVPEQSPSLASKARCVWGAVP